MAAEQERGSAREQDPTSHLADLRRMHDEAIRPDGMKRLVRSVARCLNGQAALLGADDRILHAFPALEPEVFAEATCDLERIRSGRTPTSGVRYRGKWIRTTSIGPGTDVPVLVVLAEEPDSDGLVRDATRLLWLCWQIEETRRNRHRMDLADTQTREAVLHLLMLGDRGGAARVAATLGPGLPDPCRVFVVESKPSVRDVVAARLDEAAHGQAWIVRCPVYTGHIIVVAPGVEDVTELPEAVESRVRCLAGQRGEMRVGASRVVALRDVAVGYEQAFHALTTARESAERYAVFNPRAELAALLRPAGQRWSRRLLAPLLDYVPERPQDPDSDELVVTLGSWLNFHHRAARQLKIHRNTLALRLSRLEWLLGCDPRDLGTQSMLQLALRMRDLPKSRSEGGDRSVGALFEAPAVRLWAEHQLGPLLSEDTRELLETLRAWLKCNARLDATATALGISGSGVRKRLLRIEHLLGRSLLHGPSARYSAYFALRALDGTGFPALNHALAGGAPP
ncbi:helix-turn-helix domain-containing protein [Parasphingorhabdus pacifica]